MRSYEERKAARIDRLYAKAAAKAREAESLGARAHSMASVIPLGQPILVGHHSERRDRNYRDKIHRTYSKAFEAEKESKELARRAERAESNHAISSDDPEAVARLKEKLAALEALQARMIAANKAIRAAKGRMSEALFALMSPPIDLSETCARSLLEPDFCGRIGYADYATKNNGAEIRRVKARIQALTRQAETPAPEPEEVGDVRIEEGDNRVKVFFPGKPSEEIRGALKRAGFRWAPSEGAWMAYPNYHTREQARAIARKASPPSLAIGTPPAPGPRHEKDEDCTVGENGCCTVCGVSHWIPCEKCGGKGFHKPECAAIEGE